MSRPLLLACASMLGLGIGLSAASADTLATQTGGVGFFQNPVYSGQSFTVAGTGSFDDIVFNWYDNTKSSLAYGNLYLFASAYSGTPQGLSSAPGVLGEASAANNQYAFDSSLTLVGGTQYFAYTDTSSTAQRGRVSDVYSGGQEYFSTGGNFNTNNQDLNFTVTGSPVVSVPVSSVPEPSSLTMLVTGAGAFSWFRRRRLSR